MNSQVDFGDIVITVLLSRRYWKSSWRSTLLSEYKYKTTIIFLNHLLKKVTREFNIQLKRHERIIQGSGYNRHGSRSIIFLVLIFITVNGFNSIDLTVRHRKIYRQTNWPKFVIDEAVVILMIRWTQKFMLNKLKSILLLMKIGLKCKFEYI